MSRFTTRVAFLAIAASALAALGACGDESAADPPVVGDDASNVITPQDGAADAPVADAGGDAVVDADAGPRICSDDHFCHSVVPKGQNLQGVWGDGQGIVWATSNEGNLLRWDGTSWKIHVHLTDEGGIFSIFGTGPTDVWVPTALGLYHGTGATSAALTFAPVALPGNASVLIKTVWGSGPNDLWAFGGTETPYEPPFVVGRAVHYTGPAADGGSGWTLDAPLSARGIAFRGAWGSPGSGVWVHGGEANELGEPKGVVVRREAGSTTWKNVALPDDAKTPWHPQAQYFVAASMSSDSSVWLGGFNGEFVPSLWHGSKVSDGGAGFDWTYRNLGFWERPVLALWGMAANDTWAVGQDGLVSHYDGASWKQAVIRVTDVPLAKHFWGIWGKSSDDFWVVGDQVALHRTNANKP